MLLNIATDPIVIKAVAWIIGTLITLLLGLIVYIWKDNQKQNKEKTQESIDNFKEKFEELNVIMEQHVQTQIKFNEQTHEKIEIMTRVVDGHGKSQVGMESGMSSLGRSIDGVRKWLERNAEDTRELIQTVNKHTTKIALLEEKQKKAS